MKKLLSIFFLLLLFSCQKDEKVNIQSKNEQKSISDNSLSLEKNTKSDTLSKSKIVTKSILTEAESKETYKVKLISELWKQYKYSKASATKFIAENNLDSIITYLDIAAVAACELSREDIATWQLNNIGHYSIIEFKRITGYDNRMQQLATIENLREKGLLISETKTIFNENFNILTRAEKYLFKAQLLDSEFEVSERTKAIEGNLIFIDWVGNYISDVSRKEKEK